MDRALPADDLRAAVDLVESGWDSLRGARVLVTGGTGFVGRWLVESLGLARQVHGLECSAIILTRNARRTVDRWPWIESQAWLHLVESDVRSMPDPPGPIQLILHGAVDTSPAADANTVRDVCERGVLRMIACARACGAERFHLVSSGAVYGARAPGQADPREDEPIDEAVAGPYGAYSDGKRRAEQIARRSIGGGCALTMSRVFGLAGPGLPLDGRFAMGNFIRDAVSGVPIHVRGDGRAMRSYLHGSDLAAWIWLIILQAPPFSVFNVGSPEAIGMADLARRVRDLLAPSATIAVDAGESIPATRYVPDVSSISKVLGLRATRSLDACILGTAGHYHSLANRP